MNDLETNYHDLQLKYDEMRQSERQKAKDDLDKLNKEKSLELEVQIQQLKVNDLNTGVDYKQLLG